MPTDIFYGPDLDCRFGLMADAVTDPTTWNYLELVSLALTPSRDKINRPKLGRARNNALDPTKPVDGFFKFAATLTLDADAHMLPLVLRAGLGAPTTSGPVSSVYTHLWASGVRTPQYFAIQWKVNGDTDSNPVRIIRGVTIGSVACQGGGEQNQNYDVAIGLRGLSRARASAFLGSTPSALAAEAPTSRAVYQIDGTAVSNTLQASWSWDRAISEDAFMTSAPNLSGLRPGGGTLQGTANFRALATAIDNMEEASQEFAAKLQLVNVTSGWEIDFEHPKAELQGIPLSIAGPGLIERTVSWTAHQDASNPGAKITVKNDISSYP